MKNYMKKLVCCLTFIYFNLSINQTPFSSEMFEPMAKSHFISRWNVIERMSVDLNRTVVGSDWRFDKDVLWLVY